jgi:hypothetical protein
MPIGRSRDSMVGHAKGQFWIVNLEAPLGDPPHAAPAFEVM